MADRRRAWWAVAGAAALPLHRLIRDQWRGLGEAFADAEDPYGERFVAPPRADGAAGATVTRRAGRLRAAAIAARL